MDEGHDWIQAVSEILNDQEFGSAVLMEGLHKMELEVGDGDRSTFLDNIHERVKNYLGMIFYYLVEGGLKFP